MNWARRALGCTALVASVAAAVLGGVVAPTDAEQGDIQRLMYLHVPTAWVAYLAGVAVFCCSVAWLRARTEPWVHRARAAAEIGLGSTVLTLALGSIWGAHTWGTWWAWDPRLVSTALLGVVFGVFLAVHARGESFGSRVAASAVGVVALGFLPVVHFSVLWFRSLHQPPTLLTTTPAPFDGRMLTALLVSLGALSVTAVWLWLRRVETLRIGGKPASGNATSTPVRAFAQRRAA